ncbi:hypothetical protein AB1Y20_022115 [Prymnesium parvum]|uniref:Transmembrane protein n=1 Tax=Prymnesium parvum TaxID=97485 RepID=A0AB34JIP1_PRYPA
MSVYVDDCWITDTAGARCDDELAVLSKAFALTITDAPDLFLGMNVRQHSPARLTLSSEAYVQKLCTKYSNQEQVAWLLVAVAVLAALLVAVVALLVAVAELLVAELLVAVGVAVAALLVAVVVAVLAVAVAQLLVASVVVSVAVAVAALLVAVAAAVAVAALLVAVAAAVRLLVALFLVGEDGSSGGLVGLLVVGSLLLALLLGYQLYKLTRRWTNRARSAKVLDAIEMEFVNDMEMDEELLRNTASSSSEAARQRDIAADWTSIDPTGAEARAR